MSEIVAVEISHSKRILILFTALIFSASAAGILRLFPEWVAAAEEQELSFLDFVKRKLPRFDVSEWFKRSEAKLDSEDYPDDLNKWIKGDNYDRKRTAKLKKKRKEKIYILPEI